MFKVEGGAQIQVMNKLHFEPIPLKQPGTYCKISSDTVQIKKEITEWLYEELDGVVQTGPFEGMKMLRQAPWSYLPPMLLGCYEEELHGEIERQISRLNKLEKPTISVVGCAEGYYAIGFKRRVPNAIVFAIDKSDECLSVCKRAAEENSVQLTFGVPVAAFMDADLIFMDVEGAEIAYLDPETVPGIRDRNIIVELHDYGKKQPTPAILLDRFRGTHRITLMIGGGPRAASHYKWICAMHSDYQALALSEGRPCIMYWYIMDPKGVAVA